MDKEISNINNYNHSINLIERKTLVITGINKIENFDKLHFLLNTSMGLLCIKGDDLELIKLDNNFGNITIKGKIDGFEYLDSDKDSNTKKETLFFKLFK